MSRWPDRRKRAIRKAAKQRKGWVALCALRILQAIHLHSVEPPAGGFKFEVKQ